MKQVTAATRGDRITHIEAPGCIVNIHTGLYDTQGCAVTSVEILCDQYAGEPKWSLPDFGDRTCMNVRVVEGGKQT